MGLAIYFFTTLQAFGLEYAGVLGERAGNEKTP